MASFSKLPPSPIADSLPQLASPSPFLHPAPPFADIPLRFPKLAASLTLHTSPPARACSCLSKRNAILCSLHDQAVQYPHLLCTVGLALRSPGRNRSLSASSASNASYADNVDDGVLKLGGFFIVRKDLEVAIGAATTVVLAVANKVLYKMALIPLKEYPFFLALINTFGYVVCYFSILYMRYQAGIVTEEMLKTPKLPFVLAGGLEALGLAIGMAAAANLPGTVIAIILQTFLVWQLVLSMTFLKRRYSFGQIVACGMVLTGVAIALFGGENIFQLSSNKTLLMWQLVMIVACAFQASSTIVKESVFQKTSKNLKGGSVDIFVVNSFGSAFQSIFVLVMLPFLSQLRGIPFSKLHGYLREGAGCLFNIGSMNTECAGATLLTVTYVVVNLLFNISLLSLMKRSSAVVSSLCSTLAVPISIYIFTLPLPYIGVTASVHPRFVLGVITLLAGLALYNISGHYATNAKNGEMDLLAGN